MGRINAKYSDYKTEQPNYYAFVFMPYENIDNIRTAF